LSSQVYALPPVQSEDMLRRIRSEFMEMPGLKLTVRQAGRLWGLDERTCEALIDALTESKFLIRTRDGALVRRSESI